MRIMVYKHSKIRKTPDNGTLCSRECCKNGNTVRNSGTGVIWKMHYLYGYYERDTLGQYTAGK